MSDKPRPEDYPDRINAYIRAIRAWQATQPLPPLKPIPEDLKHLFTPESLGRAQAELESVLPPDKKRRATMSQQEESPVKKSPSQVYEELVAKYGDDTISEALESEVEDAKQSEAEMINEDGAEEQVRYLLEEGMYSVERLENTLKEFTRYSEE